MAELIMGLWMWEQVGEELTTLQKFREWSRYLHTVHILGKKSGWGNSNTLSFSQSNFLLLKHKLYKTVQEEIMISLYPFK